MSAGFPSEHFAGRFVVEKTFAGGEGATALVRERATGVELVAKVLDGNVPAAEASLLQSLRHPAIPAIREVGQIDDGRTYMLREFARGRPVSELLPMSPPEALRLARQVLEVLAFVHLRGVLHLDLKPANLVLGEDGKVHLLDFGLAVRSGRRGAGGTLFFAAPEQLLGGTPDPRSDLFALGAVLVAALWPKPGRLPLARFLRQFPGESFWVAADIEPQAFPAPFPAFLERCLARRPQRRFADAQAALEFLVGGAGRPSRSLLHPDIVALHGDALTAAADAAGAADLLLQGGATSEREGLALHLLCTRSDVHGYQPEAGGMRIRRGGGDAVVWSVPALEERTLRPFLTAVLGLPGDVAAAAARHLLQEGDGTTTAIRDQLLTRADAGVIVPDGARWSWPAAAQGRLQPPPRAPRGTATPQMLLDLAAAGGGETALVHFAAAAATADAATEHRLRQALVQGLLRAGEPARALPLCGNLPAERTQALLELGRIDEAQAVLAEAQAAAAQDPSLRSTVALIAARLRASRGQVGEALAELQAAHAGVASPSPSAVQTMAALMELQGRGGEARDLLIDLLPRLPAEKAPFQRAAALTALGHAERRLGSLSAAHDHFLAARALLLKLGHAHHAATAALNLGVVAKDLQRFEEAIAHLRQARGLYEHVNDRSGAAIAEANLGSTALSAGDPVAAEKRLEPAVQALRDLGAHAAAAHATVLLAQALAEQHRGPEAERLLTGLDGAAANRLAPQIEQVRVLLTAAASPPTPAAPQPPNAMPTAQETNGPSRELFRTFLAVNRRLAHESDLEKAMATLLEAAITLTGGRQGYLLVARPDGLQREFQTGGAAPGGQAFSRSLANRAMQQQRTLTGEDALADRELQEMPSIRNLQVRSAICAPFRSAGGSEGAIYVEHSGRAGAFSEQDKESLEVLADQAAIAVDRMLREETLAKELEYSRRELAVVQRTVRRDSGTIIGDSAVMRELRQQMQKIAPLDLAVLILGETGTGKELVARGIHAQSQQARGPFVAENCSALPAELMERELFGHVTGSFTGADRDRPGLLELASGGTLFLDEVGDMPPALQAKLLRALQEKRIRRIGGSETIDVDLRILAATHKDLRAMVHSGDFREDLFFRLAAVEIRVPPLRERNGDIEVLARHFLDKLCKQHGVRRTLDAAALQQLRGYRWPGNVRELEHVVARAFLLAEGDTLVDLQLPRSEGAAAADAPAPAPAAQAWPAIPLAEAERRTIRAALLACNGEKTAAAKLLGISRTALYEKIKRYEID